MDELFFRNAPRSAYLHIPFCHRRCFYCDFAVVPLGDKASGESGPGSSSIKSYLSLLRREISLVPNGPPLATIYIGGGTPSLLTPSQIGALLADLKDRFGFQNGAEITLEIDPASFTKKDLQEYLNVGINRCSLGGQSFEDDFLEKLGRKHRAHHLIEACSWLDESYRSGKLSSWSLDLIQGLPGQDLDCWKNELTHAIGSFAPHLSIYDLSIEPGTVFAWRERRGELPLPEEDLAAEIFRCTSSILGAAGFSRYEISNYALPGHASRHNRVYWSGAGWWSFGQGSTSAPWGKRFSRPRTRDAYRCWIEVQESGRLEPSLEKINSIPIGLDDLLMVGLRRREGVELMSLGKQFGWSENQCQLYMTQLTVLWGEAIKNGWLKRHGWRFQLSDPIGMQISNQVLVQIFLWWDALPATAVAPLSSFGEHLCKADALGLMAD